MRFFTSVKFFSRRNRILPVILAAILLLSASLPIFAQDEEDKNDQNDAVKIFNLAQDAHEKGSLPDALKLYDEAIKLQPEFPEAEYQKGHALLTLGKSAEAEKSFRRAIELRADWTLPMVNLGSILIGANRFPEAEKILIKAIELDEKNFPAYVALTDLRLKTAAPPTVLKDLLVKLVNLSSKANPTVSVWASRAALERALGDRQAAKSSLNRALSIEPKNKSALLEQAEIAISESDFTSALETIKILFQITPNSVDAKVLQARVFALKGDVKEAIKILDSVENQTADIVQLRTRLEASDSVNAAELEKQLETDTKNAALLGRLCTILRADNPPKALDYCRRASEAEPDNINHAVGFGAALVQAKQYDNAVQIFKKILQIAPDNYTARANLATALFQSKRYAEAKIEYLWLTEKQPDLPIAYYFLAIAHDNLTEYPDAMANYQQFLKLADAASNKLEIEKVNLRLPSLQKQIKEKKGKK